MLNFIRKLLSKLYRKLGISADLGYIGTGVSLPPPLSKEEELRLTLLFTNADDSPAARETAEQAKNTLIEHNLRLVVYIAKKFENTGVCIEDLISIGTIGLIKAVNTFRADRNIKLATYASRCIENEILMHLRKTVKQKLEVSLDEPLNVDWDGNELLLGDILGAEQRTLTERFYVRVASEQSNIEREEDALNSPVRVETTDKGYDDLLIWFAAALLAFAFVEWWLQSRSGL